MSVTRPVYDARWVVLQELADGPLPGFEIGRRCEGRVVGSSLAWLYPLLYRLEAHGAIAGRWRTDARGRRRVYTKLGSSGRRFAGPTGPTGAAELGSENATARVAGSMDATGSASTYLDRMTRALGLPASRAEEIRREIADHLVDAGILDSNASGTGGSTETEAEAQAERLLGQPEQLAAAITLAQRERPTFSRTVLTSLLLAPVLLFCSAVGAAFCLSFVRVAAYVALRIATAAAVCSGTLALDQRQQAFPLVVGAFIAARFLAGRVFALGSTRGSVSVAITIAIGALLLGLPALTLETNLDIVSVAVLVAIPGALVAGAIRPMRYAQGLLSPRGIAAAVALGFAVIAIPIDGLLVYAAPSGISNANTVRIETGGATDFDQEGLFVTVWINAPERVSGACIDVLPVLRHGWFLDRDPATAGFSRCDSPRPGIFEVDFPVPPPSAHGREWLVLVTVLDENGQRHLVYANMDLVVPYRGSVLGWLTGRPGD